MIDIFNSFYKDKRILVTGHTGFKGSWLSIWLHELGAEIIGIAKEPLTNRDNYVLSKIGNKISADICAVFVMVRDETNFCKTPAGYCVSSCSSTLSTAKL